MKEKNNAVRTHNLSANIMELFDRFLYDHNIRIPCADKEEETQREPNNIAALYGTEYDKLFQQVEEEIVAELEEKQINIIPWIFN